MCCSNRHCGEDSKKAGRCLTRDWGRGHWNGSGLIVENVGGIGVCVFELACGR